MLEWSSPFNWCDRRCERCELAESCPSRTRELERRASHEAVGEDPDDPAVWSADVAADLEEAKKLIEEEARQQGIDLEGPLPPLPPPDPIFERLQRAGRQLAVAAHALGGEPEHVAMILAMKCGRLATRSFEEDGDVTSHDTVPNLLLLEALHAELAAALAESAAPAAALSRARERHEELRRALDPLVTLIPVDARATLAALVRADRALSPFRMNRE